MALKSRGRDLPSLNIKLEASFCLNSLRSIPTSLDSASFGAGGRKLRGGFRLDVARRDAASILTPVYFIFVILYFFHFYRKS